MLWRICTLRNSETRFSLGESVPMLTRILVAAGTAGNFILATACGGMTDGSSSVGMNTSGTGGVAGSVTAELVVP